MEKEKSNLIRRIGMGLLGLELIFAPVLTTNCSRENKTKTQSEPVLTEKQKRWQFRVHQAEVIDVGFRFINRENTKANIVSKQENYSILNFDQTYYYEIVIPYSVKHPNSGIVDEKKDFIRESIREEIYDKHDNWRRYLTEFSEKTKYPGLYGFDEIRFRVHTIYDHELSDAEKIKREDKELSELEKIAKDVSDTLKEVN